jgi:hypothetical protein
MARLWSLIDLASAQEKHAGVENAEVSMSR